MEEKIVSVCIPIYNGEKYIAKTLDSILSQTYKYIEIIVSDNCSTDNSLKIVEAYKKKDARIRINKNDRNLGYSGNLNKLIELASGEYIAIYHADDIYESNIIEEQVKFLSENKELAGCFTLGKVIDKNGAIKQNIFYYNIDKIKENTIVDLNMYIKNICEVCNMFLCPTSMIKKTVYVELNGYSLDLRYIEDQDMWIRILEKYKLAVIAKELFNYRVHGDQTSNYYLNKSRQELSVDIVHLIKYLDKNVELKNKYLPSLSKRISRDFIILARNAAYLDSYEKFAFFLSESKKNHIFMGNIKFEIMQKTNKRLLFFLLQGMNKILLFIKGVHKK